MKDFISDRVLVTCTQCLMDNHDYPEISFDEKGICIICKMNKEIAARSILKGKLADEKIALLLSNLKKHKTKDGYHCILGVSGGIDSTYLAYLCKTWGLNPLVVHVDGGWNTSQSVMNIENSIKTLGFDLHTIVLNWEKMREAQKAFMRADVLDVDLPFDNAFFAAIYKVAMKNKIKFVLMGHNASTEGYMPPTFTHYKLDSINLKYIYKKFGAVSLNKFPVIGPVKSWYYNKVLKINMVFPLNWVEYDKEQVKQMMIEKLNWIEYAQKHYENIFTRFYQGFILPEKFNIDKRKAHLSSLIISNQLTREKAIEILNTENPYKDEALKEKDKEFFLKKMQLTTEEFQDYINRPPVLHTDYPSWINVFNKLRPIKKLLKLKRKTYVSD
jgi:N-acetyl sugar amidotransferase